MLFCFFLILDYRVYPDYETAGVTPSELFARPRFYAGSVNTWVVNRKFFSNLALQKGLVFLQFKFHREGFGRTAPIKCQIHFSSSCRQLHSLPSRAHLCRGNTIHNTEAEAVSSLGVESETQHVTSSEKCPLSCRCSSGCSWPPPDRGKSAVPSLSSLCCSSGLSQTPTFACSFYCLRNIFVEKPSDVTLFVSELVEQNQEWPKCRGLTLHVAAVLPAADVGTAALGCLRFSA